MAMRVQLVRKQAVKWITDLLLRFSIPVYSTSVQVIMSIIQVTGTVTQNKISQAFQSVQ